MQRVLGQQLHPAIAQAILNGEKGKELYRIVYLAKVFPDLDDLSTVVLMQVTQHAFAVDADDIREQLRDNLPEGVAEVLNVLGITTVQGVEEESMIKVQQLGPRKLEH